MRICKALFILAVSLFYGCRSHLNETEEKLTGGWLKTENNFIIGPGIHFYKDRTFADPNVSSRFEPVKWRVDGKNIYMSYNVNTRDLSWGGSLLSLFTRKVKWRIISLNDSILQVEETKTRLPLQITTLKRAKMGGKFVTE